MLNRLIGLWGVNERGLIALEYQVGFDIDEVNLGIYSDFFHKLYPEFYIEYVERFGIVLSPDDGWYLCCTTGDGAPVAIYLDKVTTEQMEKFATLSEDFYAVCTSILDDIIED